MLDTTVFYEFAKEQPMNSRSEFIKKYGQNLYIQLHRKVKKHFEKMLRCSLKSYHFHNFGTTPEDYFREDMYVPLTLEQHTSIHFKDKSFTEEHKQNISKALKKIGIDHSGENNPMYNKHHTEETRKQISEKLKGENGYWYGKTGPTKWFPTQKELVFIETKIDAGCSFSYVGRVLGKALQTIQRVYNEIKEGKITID